MVLPRMFYQQQKEKNEITSFQAVIIETNCFM